MAVTLLYALELLEEVWEHTYVVPVDLSEIEECFLSPTMV
jgi:hypothetical protein